jgi:hypothetical protein
VPARQFLVPLACAVGPGEGKQTSRRFERRDRLKSDIELVRLSRGRPCPLTRQCAARAPVPRRRNVPPVWAPRVDGREYRWVPDRVHAPGASRVGGVCWRRRSRVSRGSRRESLPHDALTRCSASNGLVHVGERTDSPRLLRRLPSAVISKLGRWLPQAVRSQPRRPLPCRGKPISSTTRVGIWRGACARPQRSAGGLARTLHQRARPIRNLPERCAGLGGRAWRKEARVGGKQRGA